MFLLLHRRTRRVPIGFVAALLSLMVAACGGGGGGGPEPVRYPATIETVTLTPSAPELPQRAVRIYLPSDYQPNGSGFSVLYMQDGQGVFSDNNGWQIEQAIETAVHAGTARGTIVVAIDNTLNRNSEYVPWNWHDEWNSVDRTGMGDIYVRWIRDELKPWIDAHYNTASDRAHTAIGGSSLGGLIATYAGMQYPDTFGKVLAMSPSYWVNSLQINETVNASSRTDTRVYIDCGALEWEFAAETAAVQQAMLARHLGPVSYIVDANAGTNDSAHNNFVWRRRFPAAWAWLFADVQ